MTQWVRLLLRQSVHFAYVLEYSCDSTMSKKRTHNFHGVVNIEITCVCLDVEFKVQGSHTQAAPAQHYRAWSPYRGCQWWDLLIRSNGTPLWRMLSERVHTVYSRGQFWEAVKKRRMMRTIFLCRCVSFHVCADIDWSLNSMWVCVSGGRCKTTRKEGNWAACV